MESSSVVKLVFLLESLAREEATDNNNVLTIVYVLSDFAWSKHRVRHHVVVVFQSSKFRSPTM
jgi:hypothetical protein